MTELAEKRWRIGRLGQTNSRVRFAFYLRRTEEGGLRISGMSEEGITDTERQLLFAHFGAPKTVLTGGTDKDGTQWTGTTVSQPGTEEQFLDAMCMLPFPFARMSGDD